MLPAEFEKIQNSIKEKLGEENMAKISDDISTLMLDNNNMENSINTKNTEIQKLKEDKEQLVTTNGKLMQKISIETTEEKRERENTQEKKKKYSLANAFDEKGNFI